MRLRRPCEHRQYDEHFFDSSRQFCPGGEFLPENAIGDSVLEAKVIEESIDYLRNRFELQLNFDDITPWSHVMVAAEDRAGWLKALAASQVGEPG